MQQRTCLPIVARGLFAATLLGAAIGCGSDPTYSVPPPEPGPGEDNGSSGKDAGSDENDGDRRDGGAADGEVPANTDGGVPSEDPDGGDVPLGPVDWPSAECKARAEGLVAQMTAREMAAQMVMAMVDASGPSLESLRTEAPGAIFADGALVPPGGYAPSNWATLTDPLLKAVSESRLGIPAFFGIDAMHGNGKATGTVIFPHNAGLGSTRDLELVREIGRITALEVAAMGANWTYAPMVSPSWDDRWGRVYESFGEDPVLCGEMGEAVTRGLQGLQGLGTGAPGIVACAKHFAGDGQATFGTSTKGGTLDRGDSRIDEATMRRVGIAPYIPLIEAGVGSIMASDAFWNGTNMTIDKHLIVDILKGELGFKGFVVTDWNSAKDYGGGWANTINAGIDMLMEPNYQGHTWLDAIEEIASNQVSDERRVDAATRIVQAKCQAGLFEASRDPALMSQVGSADHRALARRAVRESLVLLQNDNAALPLAKSAKVWVAGTGANSLTNQCGGWTIEWQGNGNLTQGTTISEAIDKVATRVDQLQDADVAVVVVSERPYAEFLGDVSMLNANLAGDDFALLAQAKAAGKKVVAIVMTGRPVLITDQLDNADAWLAAWLPGTEGDGVADVLFGDYPPTGKLSHSWPRTADQANSNVGAPGYDPLFPLDFGLTY
jgi:beta-glucosidase